MCDVLFHQYHFKNVLWDFSFCVGVFNAEGSDIRKLSRGCEAIMCGQERKFLFRWPKKLDFYVFVRLVETHLMCYRKLIHVFNYYQVSSDFSLTSKKEFLVAARLLWCVMVTFQNEGWPWHEGEAEKRVFKAISGKGFYCRSDFLRFQHPFCILAKNAAH